MTTETNLGRPLTTWYFPRKLMRFTNTLPVSSRLLNGSGLLTTLEIKTCVQEQRQQTEQINAITVSRHVSKIAAVDTCSIKALNKFKSFA